MIAASPTQVPAKRSALRESSQRTAPRAIERLRQRKASAIKPKATIRDRTASPSGSRAGRTRPHATPAASVTITIVVPRRSLLTSRWIVARRRPTPKSTIVHGTMASGAMPVVTTCASAAMVVNATASTKQRAPMRTATAALPRTAQLPWMQNVEYDASSAEMRCEAYVRGRDADPEHTVMRSPEREHRAGEAGRDLRRHHDERRAPGQPAALAEEHCLRRIRGVGPEAREDLQRPRERMRTPAE